MNEQLAASHELVAALGFDEVTNCEQAHSFTVEYQRQMGLLAVQTDADRALSDDEVSGLEREDEPGSIEKIHLGDTVPYGNINDGVVRLWTDQSSCGGGWGSCTATFISQWHLMTAAHCFCVGGDQGIAVEGFNHDAGGTWGYLPRTDGTVIWGVFAYIYPNYTGTGDFANDLAVVSFKQTAIPHAHNHASNRFRIYEDSFYSQHLDILGTGARTMNGSGAGVLRSGRYGQQIWANHYTSSYFRATVPEDHDASARGCLGDSGGPALGDVIDASGNLRYINFGVYALMQHDTPLRDNQCPSKGHRMWWSQTANKYTWIRDVIRNNVAYPPTFECFQGSFTGGGATRHFRRCW